MRALPILLSCLVSVSACGDADGGSPLSAADVAQASDARADTWDVDLEAPDSESEAPRDASADGDPLADTEPATPDASAPDVEAADVPSLDADGAPEDTAAADTAEPPLPCPVITVAQGQLVSPPVTLHLSSEASTGDPVTVRWTLVAAPDGHVEDLPADRRNAREVSLEATLAGDYTVRLEAFDELGRSGCAPAESTITARPSSPVHLELVWGDGTPHPELPVGADLDLHVFHPDAVGLDLDGDGEGDGWFDPLLDCAWHNPTPTWSAPQGAADPAPRLLRRDDDGRGPEVIAIAAPAPDLAYVVGFHVYDDRAGLYIQPTEIRIWIDGVLKNRPSFAVPVRASRLERVLTVEYPSGRLTFPFATDGDMRPTSPAK